MKNIRSDVLDNKDKESLYYKELRDLVNKNTFDKVLECAFKIYNHEFNVKGTNGKDYSVLKKIYDMSNKISKDSLQTLLIKILSNDFKETQLKLLDLIYKTKNIKYQPEKIENKPEENPNMRKTRSSDNKDKEKEINKQIIEKKEKEKKIKDKAKKNSENAELVRRILENEEIEKKKNKMDTELASNIPTRNKSKPNRRNINNNIENNSTKNNNNIQANSQPAKRRHQKKPSPPFYFGKHFYKKNNKVYCYVPKAKTSSFNHYTLYCTNRGGKEICKAKIIIQQNDSKTVFIGNHTCHPKLTVEDFYAKYPNVKRNDE